MDICKAVDMYNNHGMNLEQIANELGTSKTTLSRVLKKDGWVFDKKSKKYISETTIECNNIAVNKHNNIELNKEKCETANTVPRETKMVNYTIALSEDMAKALRVKCAIEGTKMATVVREALSKVIEEKYYNL